MVQILLLHKSRFNSKRRDAVHEWWVLRIPRSIDQCRTSDGRWHVFCVLHKDSWSDCGSTSIPHPSLEIGHGLVLS